MREGQTSGDGVQVAAQAPEGRDALSDRGIRVNCIAPGPIWTPLIPTTFDADRVEGFGEQSPTGRAAEPDETVPSCIFFASNRFSSFTPGRTSCPPAARSTQADPAYAPHCRP
jgi:NAD(P)-dependent dehydrogenase (short-subunit alcohol dehydrogenase family)